VDRLSRTLSDLLALERADRTPACLEAVDVRADVLDRAAFWEAVADRRGVTIDVEGPAALAAAAPGALLQVLDVLLDNALHVSPESGRVLVRIVPASTSVGVHVIDEGPGMTREERLRACEPFWRGPESARRGGTGLGLAIACAFLRSGGGRLTLAPAGARGLDAAAHLTPWPAADAVPGRPGCALAEVSVPASRLLSTRDERPVRGRR
jgi:signal transduction histidine kinase